MGVDQGAVTWIDGAAGLINGPVTAANSLIGGSAGDRAGSEGIYTLDGNNNYLVLTPTWQNGGVIDAGAVTWANGNTGITGIIDASNSLVGSSYSDYIGLYYSISDVGNGNYVVFSSGWDNGLETDAGALTWGSGTSGVSGVIGASNSLIASTTDDMNWSTSLVRLANGNLLLTMPEWDNLSAVDAGAAVFIDANLGKSGVIGASNALVGTTSDDRIGRYYETLDNGNYLVYSEYWDNGAAIDAGALAWGSGVTGVSGVVSAANALVGTTSYDYVGSYTVLTNGNYVAYASYWDNGGIVNAGAATWADGTTGITGVVSAANSLVGSNANDYIGSDGVQALTNGNYIVSSRFWRNGAAFRAGASTWADGTTGITGAVSTANSLYGTASYDYVGFRGAVALANGNYVVQSDGWNGSRGAATWGDGATGTIGGVSILNSIVGTNAGDRLTFNAGWSGITALANGDYFLTHSSWDSGTTANVGAMRLLDGTMPSSGVLDETNSLVGSTAGDLAGYYVFDLENGNYIIQASYWDNGMAQDAGALTFVNGATGITGVISAANSLVGSSSFDRIGQDNNFLSNGFYVTKNSYWDNGLEQDAGAVTFINITTGLTGAISASNSLVGTTAFDQIGTNIIELQNGMYVITSNYWDNGANADAGAITFLNGTTGYTGEVNASNSLVGSTAGDQIGSYIEELSNGGVAIVTFGWDDGANTDVGAVTFADNNEVLTGVISLSNSLIGPGSSSGMYTYGEDTINGTYIVSFEGFERVFAYAINGGGASLSDYNSYNDFANSTITLDPSFITSVLNSGTAVTLQASNDITINDDIISDNTVGDGGDLTLQAGRSILINANITTDNGNLNLYGNERLATGVVNAQRTAGDAVITMAAGMLLDAGTGDVNIRLDDGLGKTNRGAGNITLRDIIADTITAVNKNSTGDIVLQSGSLIAGGAGNSILLSSNRNFINNAGLAALDIQPGANWLVYSTRDTSNIEGGLVADYSLFACLYSGPCPALGAGNGFLYSYDPTTVSETPVQTTPEVPDTVLYVSQAPLPARTGESANFTTESFALTEMDNLFDKTSPLFGGWILIDPILIKELDLEEYKL